MVKWLLTLGCVVALLALARNANAWGNEYKYSAVDWEDAFEYAKVLETYKDEYGVKWVTYMDEAQELMWSQPSSASEEDVLDYLTFDEVGTYTLDLCVVLWLWPDELKIDSSTYKYTSFTYEDKCFGTYRCKEYYTTGSVCHEDIDGYVRSEATSSGDHCSNYDGKYSDKNGPGSWDDSQTDACETIGDTTYYESYENSDVNGDDEWDYCSGSTTRVTRHRFYTCEAWYNILIGYRYVIE